jgi:hypothetical protein
MTSARDIKLGRPIPLDLDFWFRRLFAAVLLLSYIPVFALSVPLFLLLLFWHYVVRSRRPPPSGPPPSRGGCWTTIFPPAWTSRLSRETRTCWLSADGLRLAIRFAQGNGYPWPFVRVLRLSRNTWHVLPRHVPGGRLCHASNLRPGWYGAGMTPDFFADSPLRVAALAMHMGDYAGSYRHAQVSSPFACSGAALEHLSHAGLPPPVPGSKPHSHPVHVAYELLSLHVAARLLRGSEWFGLWLRQEKVDHMVTTTPGSAPPQALFNPRYLAKDLTRYQRSPPPVHLTSLARD